MTLEPVEVGAEGPKPAPPLFLRVLVVDDKPMVRQGLTILLETRTGIVTCGQAASLAEAADAAARLRPDVVLADIRLANTPEAIEAARAIRTRHPKTRLLFLTAFADEDVVLVTVLSGAAGYLLKQVGGASLVGDLLRVVEGETLLDSSVVESALDRVVRLLTAHGARPSDEEEEVLSMIAHGETDRQIALSMGFSAGELERLVTHVLMKVASAREAALPNIAASSTSV